jgi:hypothetical protein
MPAMDWKRAFLEAGTAYFSVRTSCQLIRAAAQVHPLLFPITAQPEAEVALEDPVAPLSGSADGFADFRA